MMGTGLATTNELDVIKTLYPELSHWGSATLGHVWFDFSQDVFEVNWVDWMLGGCRIMVRYN